MKKEVVSNLLVAAVILGGILVNIPIGVIFYYGNLSTYTDSYFIGSVGMENHNAGSIWITTLWSVTLMACMTISGILSRKIGPRLTLLSGMICFNLAIYTSFFALQSSFWSLHITFGLLAGVGAGFCYSMTLLYVATWVKKRVGLASATVSSALGGGSIIFNLAVTLFINPQNVQPDVNVGLSKYFSQDEILNHMPFVFLILGALTTGCHAIAFPLMRNHPDFAKIRSIKKSTSKTSLRENSCMDGTDNSCMDGSVSKSKNSEQYGATEYVDISATNSNQQEKWTSNNTDTGLNNRPITSRQEIKSATFTSGQVLQVKAFYLLALSFCLLMVAVVVENTSYKQYGVLFISDDYFLANIGVGINIATCFSRIIFGLMLDKLDVKSVLISLTASHTIISVFWYFTPFVDKWFYLIWTVILTGIQSGTLIVFPISTLKIFGSEHYITNYGMVSTFGAFVQFAMPPLVEVILTELGWFWLFFSVSITSLVALILIIFMQYPSAPEGT